MRITAHDWAGQASQFSLVPDYVFGRAALGGSPAERVSNFWEPIAM